MEGGEEEMEGEKKREGGREEEKEGGEREQFQSLLILNDNESWKFFHRYEMKKTLT